MPKREPQAQACITPNLPRSSCEKGAGETADDPSNRRPFRRRFTKENFAK